MILTCPNCGTQYVVKDGAIPPAGRQVRCASCKHSWHQDPETSEATPEAMEVAAPPIEEPPIEADRVDEDDADETLAEATLIEPRSGPELEERAFEEAVIEGQTEPAAPGPPAPSDTDVESATYAGHPVGVHRREAPAEDWREPPEDEAQDDEFSPFPAVDEVAPRRRSPIGKLLLIVLVVAALAAAFWFLAPPEWKAQLGLGVGGASPLALVTTHMDRQKLESGEELLTVSGRVINPTNKEQDVPPLQAQLKDRTGKVVYRWTIQPPAPTLAPGASAGFNSAELRVPPNGEELTISIGSPGA